MRFRSLLVVLLVGILAGCAPMTREMPRPGDASWAPVEPQVLSKPAPVDGSIYTSVAGYTLYGDRTATRVGDVLTVVLQETTQAKKSSGTTVSKNSKNELNEASILGTSVSASNLSLLTNPEHKRSFSGSSDSDQSNSLSGTITVTVAEQLPNGLLRIRGEKWLQLNEGDEYIRIMGLVRQEDIGVDNTILSTKIADARIAYSGTGAFADVNRQGWLTRFFNSEWWPL